MSRFPNTRLALARLFANLAICCLPMSERGCIDTGFAFADLLLHRATSVREQTASDPDARDLRRIAIVLAVTVIAGIGYGAWYWVAG